VTVEDLAAALAVVTVATVVIGEEADEAGQEAARMRKRSGCQSPSWAASFSRQASLIHKINMAYVTMMWIESGS
jgi:hypothetical protein